MRGVELGDPYTLLSDCSARSELGTEGRDVPTPLTREFVVGADVPSMTGAEEAAAFTILRLGWTGHGPGTRLLSNCLWQAGAPCNRHCIGAILWENCLGKERLNQLFLLASEFSLLAMGFRPALWQWYKGVKGVI